MLVFTLAALALPCVAFAQDVPSDAALGSSLSALHDVAPWIAICGAIATCALGLTKFLPGWATKLNLVAALATGVGSALGALGAKATLVAIVLAVIGALIGYNRSEDRAAGKSVVS